MESSASLLEFQKQQLVSLNRHELIDKVEFLHMDIAQAAESPEYVASMNPFSIVYRIYYLKQFRCIASILLLY
jgi:hypothetical protein